MKTKSIFTYAAIAMFLGAVTFSGCSKDNDESKQVDTSSMQKLAADEENVENMTDEALNDVTNVMGGNQLKSTDGWPCHATVDSAVVDNDTIAFYITYDGLNCRRNKIITGQVITKRKVGEFWGMPGTTVNVQFINYSVTRVSTNKTIVLNGYKTLQNVSGGFIWQLGSAATSIVHRTSGSMVTTFDNGTSRTWNFARQRVFTGTPDNLILTIDGFGTANGYENLAAWGTNRDGEEFYTQITQSIIHNDLCDWRPVSGIKIHQVPADDKSATITYGYDDNNQPVTGDDCPTKYRLDWVKNGQSGTVYLSLH
ncbi:MAG: hypothetical protein CVU06_10875 [Bacteroidetes bacterium HGW-Bacteroidetes-22]|nr:MAG: hypothetical protein CVU06_10875 [Bacteroidetes bacterium HGW-Bacteroidetes-22]